MKEKLCAIAIVLSILVCCQPASAQLKGFSFGPYFEAAWPKGDLATTNTNGIGLGVSADVKLGGKLAATGSVGYMYFGKKVVNQNTSSERISAIPIRAGLKYKLPIIYLKLESGVAKFRNDNTSALIVSPGIGFRILGLDVQGSYETWLAEEGRSFASLKLAYHF